MLPSEPGVRLSIGLPKSGKTHTIRLDVFDASRLYPVLVLDSSGEWSRAPFNRVPGDLAAATCYARDVAHAITETERGKRLVIFKPRDKAGDAERALAWAIAKPGPAGVYVSEAHFAFEVHRPLGPAAMEVISGARHVDVSMWTCTQRLAMINRGFDLAQLIRIYSATDGDMQRIRTIGGNDLVRAVRECAIRNAAQDRGGWGEPGWHVALHEGVRLGGYEPQRER